MIVLSENFRALFYAPFYAAYATGAFRDAGVEVALRPSPDPAAAARALRSGEVDVMWGGPLRVMIVHDSEPEADLVCFADVVARDPFFVIGAQAAARLPPGRSRQGQVRLGVRSADALDLPGRRPAPRRGRSRPPRPRLGTVDGRQRRSDPRRHARGGAALPALCRGAVGLGRGPSLVRRRHARPHRLHHAGDAPRHPRAPRRRSFPDDRACTARSAGSPPRRPSRSPARWAITSPSREAIFAAAIERYRTLGLWGPDPVIRREGYDRLHAAMRAVGTLKRDIPYEICVDTSLAERAS